eukprot:3012368-Karenia_brevis.AAC.1
MVAGTANFESPTGAVGASAAGAAERRVDEKAANFHLSTGEQEEDDFDEHETEEQVETSDEDEDGWKRPKL